MFKNAILKLLSLSLRLVAVVLIVIALLTVFARISLPLLANDKSGLEQRVSEYLKSPVSIGDLSLHWTGFGPQLYASNVLIQNSEQLNVTLDELRIDIDVPQSLLLGKLTIKELSLVGADLLLEADAEGQFQLYGAASARPDAGTSNQSSTASRGLDIVTWLFSVEKIALLDTQVTLVDQRINERFLLDNINIRVENSGRSHKLRIHCDLPEFLGGILEVGVDLNGSARQLSQLAGDFYFKANDFNLKGVMELLALGGVSNNLEASVADLDADAAVEFWGTWQDGQLATLRGPITLAGLTHSDTGAALLDGVSLQLDVENTAAMTQIVARSPTLKLGNQALMLDEVRLSRSKKQPTVALEASGAEQVSAQEAAEDVSTAQTSRWQLQTSADVVPLKLLGSTVAAALSEVQPSWADALQNTDISGSLKDVSLIVRNLDSEPLISLSANTDNLKVAGNEKLPEFGPVSATMSLVDSVGTIELLAEQTPFSWASVSDQQLQIDRMESTLTIDAHDRTQMALNGHVQLNDEGIALDSAINILLAQGSAPHLDIRSRFNAADITQLKAWLPEQLMGPGATGWFRQAIVGGEAKDGRILFFGHVDEFPFEQGEGVFRASVDISQGALAFLPDWPTVVGIESTLEVDRLTFTGVSDQAQLPPFNLTSTSFSIDNILAPVVEFAGTGDGSLQKLRDFAVNGPLADILEPALEDMSGTGDTQMDLALTVPLFDQPAADATGPLASTWEPFKVNGSLFLSGNNVSFGRADLLMKDAVGSIGFNESGVAINKVEGNVLHQRVLLSGKTTGTGEEASTTISVSGAMEANDLLAHYENPLDQFIRGASLWNASIEIPHSSERLSREGVQLDVSSDLVGSQLLLPAPFNKSSSTSIPFQLSTRFVEDASRQQWQVDYGDQLRANVELVDEELQSVLVQLGADELAQTGNGVTDTPADQATFEGIRLQGRVSRLAADGWIETVAKYIESLPDTDPEDRTPILPVSTQLTADALLLGDTSFGKVDLQSSVESAYLNFTVSNQALKGNLQYPRNHWDKTTPLIAQVDLLDWSVIEALEEDATDAAASANSTPLDPRLLPPVNARLSVLRRGKMQLRDLAIRTEPNVSGLDVVALGFAYDTMRLIGFGHWYLRDPQEVNVSSVQRHVTNLNLTLQGSDFGAGLDHVGLDGILTDTQGSMDVQLGWPGPLYLPDFASLDGTIDLDLKAGSIVPLEPGPGRLVGLFALQTLPRRLSLDFKDLTGEGLAFTTITGEASIRNGVVDTPLLQLTGPIGVVDITGTSNLSTEELDQQVTVLPRVSAALPIIGAIAGGASAGIGALVAAGFLKAIGVDFDRIGLRTYTLSGPWAEPQLTPVPSDFLGRR